MPHPVSKIRPGESLTYYGQIYTCTMRRPYTRRDGSSTVLIELASHCADCGTSFTFSVPATSNKFEPNRRCEAHKSPGKAAS